jgi:hypothetical protein
MNPVFIGVLRKFQNLYFFENARLCPEIWVGAAFTSIAEGHAVRRDSPAIRPPFQINAQHFSSAMHRMSTVSNLLCRASPDTLIWLQKT